MPRSNDPRDLINALEARVEELSMNASTKITGSEDFDLSDPEFEKISDIIVDYGVATEDEIQLVCKINGWTIDSLNDIIYARTGYKDIDSYLDEFDFAE